MNLFDINECKTKCKSMDSCQRIVLINNECYFYDVYDPFYQVECRLSPDCNGSYILTSNKALIRG